MAGKGLPSVRSALGRGMRNLPQYKSEGNQELCLLRLRKERERLVQEKQRLKMKLDIISVRLGEIVIVEGGLRKAIGGVPVKPTALTVPLDPEPPTAQDEVLIRY